MLPSIASSATSVSLCRDSVGRSRDDSVSTHVYPDVPASSPRPTAEAKASAGSSETASTPQHRRSDLLRPVSSPHAPVQGTPQTCTTNTASSAGKASPLAAIPAAASGQAQRLSLDRGGHRGRENADREDAAAGPPCPHPARTSLASSSPKQHQQRQTESSRDGEGGEEADGATLRAASPSALAPAAIPSHPPQQQPLSRSADSLARPPPLADRAALRRRASSAQQEVLHSPATLTEEQSPAHPGAACFAAAAGGDWLSSPIDPDEAAAGQSCTMPQNVNSNNSHTQDSATSLSSLVRSSPSTMLPQVPSGTSRLSARRTSADYSSSSSGGNLLQGRSLPSTGAAGVGAVVGTTPATETSSTTPAGSSSCLRGGARLADADAGPRTSPSPRRKPVNTALPPRQQLDGGNAEEPQRIEDGAPTSLPHIRDTRQLRGGSNNNTSSLQLSFASMSSARRSLSTHLGDANTIDGADSAHHSSHRSRGWCRCCCNAENVPPQDKPFGTTASSRRFTSLVSAPALAEGSHRIPHTSCAIDVPNGAERDASFHAEGHVNHPRNAAGGRDDLASAKRAPGEASHVFTARHDEGKDNLPDHNTNANDWSWRAYSPITSRAGDQGGKGGEGAVSRSAASSGLRDGTSTMATTKSTSSFSPHGLESTLGVMSIPSEQTESATPRLAEKPPPPPLLTAYRRFVTAVQRAAERGFQSPTSPSLAVTPAPLSPTRHCADSHDTTSTTTQTAATRATVSSNADDAHSAQPSSEGHERCRQSGSSIRSSGGSGGGGGGRRERNGPLSHPPQLRPFLARVEDASRDPTAADDVGSHEQSSPALYGAAEMRSPTLHETFHPHGFLSDREGVSASANSLRSAGASTPLPGSRSARAAAVAAAAASGSLSGPNVGLRQTARSTTDASFRSLSSGRLAARSPHPLPPPPPNEWAAAGAAAVPSCEGRSARQGDVSGGGSGGVTAPRAATPGDPTAPSGAAQRARLEVVLFSSISSEQQQPSQPQQPQHPFHGRHFHSGSPFTLMSNPNHLHHNTAGGGTGDNSFPKSESVSGFAGSFSELDLSASPGPARRPQPPQQSHQPLQSLLSPRDRPGGGSISTQHLTSIARHQPTASSISVSSMGAFILKNDIVPPLPHVDRSMGSLSSAALGAGGVGGSAISSSTSRRPPASAAHPHSHVHASHSHWTKPHTAAATATATSSGGHSREAVVLTMTDGRQVVVSAPRPPSAASDDGFAAAFTPSFLLSNTTAAPSPPASPGRSHARIPSAPAFAAARADPSGGVRCLARNEDAEGVVAEGGAAWEEEKADGVAAAAPPLSREEALLRRQVRNTLRNQLVRRAGERHWRRRTAFVEYTARTIRARGQVCFAKPRAAAEAAAAVAAPGSAAAIECEVVADALSIDGETDGDDCASDASHSYASSFYGSRVDATEVLEEDRGGDEADLPATAAADRAEGFTHFYQRDEATGCKVRKRHARFLRWHHLRRRRRDAGEGQENEEEEKKKNEGTEKEQAAGQGCGAWEATPSRRPIPRADSTLLFLEDVDQEALPDVDNRLRGYLGLNGANIPTTASPPAPPKTLANDGGGTGALDALFTLVPVPAEVAARTGYHLSDYFARCPTCDPTAVLPISSSAPASGQRRAVDGGRMRRRDDLDGGLAKDGARHSGWAAAAGHINDHQYWHGPRAPSSTDRAARRKQQQQQQQRQVREPAQASSRKRSRKRRSRALGSCDSAGEEEEEEGQGAATMDAAAATSVFTDLATTSNDVRRSRRSWRRPAHRPHGISSDAASSLRAKDSWANSSSHRYTDDFSDDDDKSDEDEQDADHDDSSRSPRALMGHTRGSSVLTGFEAACPADSPPRFREEEEERAEGGEGDSDSHADAGYTSDAYSCCSCSFCVSQCRHGSGRGSREHGEGRRDGEEEEEEERGACVCRCATCAAHRTALPPTIPRRAAPATLPNILCLDLGGGELCYVDRRTATGAAKLLASAALRQEQQRRAVRAEEEEAAPVACDAAALRKGYRRHRPHHRNGRLLTMLPQPHLPVARGGGGGGTSKRDKDAAAAAPCAPREALAAPRRSASMSQLGRDRAGGGACPYGHVHVHDSDGEDDEMSFFDVAGCDDRDVADMSDCVAASPTESRPINSSNSSRAAGGVDTSPSGGAVSAAAVSGSPFQRHARRVTLPPSATAPAMRRISAERVDTVLPPPCSPHLSGPVSSPVSRASPRTTTDSYPARYPSASLGAIALPSGGLSPVPAATSSSPQQSPRLWGGPIPLPSAEDEYGGFGGFISGTSHPPPRGRTNGTDGGGADGREVGSLSPPPGCFGRGRSAGSQSLDSGIPQQQQQQRAVLRYSPGPHRSSGSNASLPESVVHAACHGAARSSSFGVLGLGRPYSNSPPAPSGLSHAFLRHASEDTLLSTAMSAYPASLQPPPSTCASPRSPAGPPSWHSSAAKASPAGVAGRPPDEAAPSCQGQPCSRRQLNFGERSSPSFSVTPTTTMPAAGSARGAPARAEAARSRRGSDDDADDDSSFAADPDTATREGQEGLTETAPNAWEAQVGGEATPGHSHERALATVSGASIAKSAPAAQRGAAAGGAGSPTGTPATGTGRTPKQHAHLYRPLGTPVRAATASLSFPSPARASPPTVMQTVTSPSPQKPTQRFAQTGQAQRPPQHSSSSQHRTATAAGQTSPQRLLYVPRQARVLGPPDSGRGNPPQAAPTAMPDAAATSSAIGSTSAGTRMSPQGTGQAASMTAAGAARGSATGPHSQAARGTAPAASTRDDIPSAPSVLATAPPTHPHHRPQQEQPPTPHPHSHLQRRRVADSVGAGEAVAPVKPRLASQGGLFTLPVFSRTSSQSPPPSRS